MIYSGLEVDESGKAMECPECGNTEISDGDYCKICGTMIVNRCGQVAYDPYGQNPKPIPCEASIQHSLPGNARFCPYCGNETSFLKNGLLKKWDAKQDESESYIVSTGGTSPFLK
jgi:predicted RNA-binding Zn-ribbon protein involved in translation (DUF1610 family)